MVSSRIRILLYGSNIWYFGEGMLGPLFAVFAERIGGSILDISWAWATYLVFTGIFVMFVGKISDGRSKEKLMVLGYALNALFTFAYLLVSSPVHLFMVQAGLGIASALAIPTWSALYSSSGSRKQKGYEWGLVTGEARILTAAGMVLGGFIASYLGFPTLFIIMGIVQVAATVYQAKILWV
jgi:MFS family permease